MNTAIKNIHRIIFATLVCVVFLVLYVYTCERYSGVLKVFFLDIGQGDAIFIQTPDRRDMLVDGGPGKIVIERLSEIMPWYDKSIDVVLESHPDSDHIGGLPDVLARYHVGLFIESGVTSPNAIDDELIRLRKKYALDHVIARRGMRVNFGDGAHFDILYPDSDVTFLETNTASIVGKMVYGKTSFMLTGDSPKSIEDHLVSIDSNRLKSDVLKAGHHGSHTSSGEIYVKTVSPEYAVISADKNNRYGHPHKEVTDLFAKLDIQTLRTDISGTIGFVSDGSRVWKK